jgi:hypothetical protein
MRTTRHGLSLALVCCAVALVHTTPAASQSSSDTSTQKSKTLLPCAPANLKTGYSQDVKFPNSDRKVKVYDTDYDETHKHDPICLSKENGDAIFWFSVSGKNFKLKVYPQDDASNCGRHPFKFDPTQDSVDGYYSGPLRPDVPEGCLYNVEFQREGGKPADPHIQITH